MSIGEAALANLQQQITNILNQINNLQNEINTINSNISSIQTALNSKVTIATPLPGYVGLFVNGTLNGNVDVFKIQLLSNDNPQFYVFDWYGLNGPQNSSTDYVQWPFSSVPVQYTPSSNVTYTISGSPYASPYTYSQQLGYYQMQFPSGQGNYFYLHLAQVLTEEEAKKIGLRPKIAHDNEEIVDKIVKEFSDNVRKKQPASVSIPLGNSVKNDRVCFWHMEYYNPFQNQETK